MQMLLASVLAILGYVHLDTKPVVLAYEARYPECDNTRMIQIDVLNAHLIESKDFSETDNGARLECRSKICKKIKEGFSKSSYIVDYAFDPKFPSRITVVVSEGQSPQYALRSAVLALQQSLVTSGVLAKGGAEPAKAETIHQYPCFTAAGELREKPSAKEKTFVLASSDASTDFEREDFVRKFPDKKPMLLSESAPAKTVTFWPFEKNLTKTEVLENPEKYKAEMYTVQVIIGVKGAKGVWGPLTDQILLNYKRNCFSKQGKVLTSELVLDVVTRTCLAEDYASRFGKKDPKTVFQERAK